MILTDFFLADLTEFCQCLLEEGEMNPNVENLHAPPLLSAARNSNVEMTLSLLKNGASVRTSIDRDTQRTIIHVALHQTSPGLTTNYFFLFPFCENSLICLEGKSITPH